jgi:hypothetical protein
MVIKKVASFELKPEEEMELSHTGSWVSRSKRWLCLSQKQIFVASSYSLMM